MRVRPLSHLLPLSPPLPANDVGRSSFRIIGIAKTFSFAYGRLAETAEDSSLESYYLAPSLLSRILPDDPSLESWREYIRSLYPDHEEEKEEKQEERERKPDKRRRDEEEQDRDSKRQRKD